LSGETIPLLARHHWFSEGLTGEHTPLVSQGPLYSADLTAATEWITHETAAAVMNGIADALDWSSSKRIAALALVGPQLLRSGGSADWKKTTNSVLLGLGISWTCLSVVNAYCAAPDDLKDRTLKVCGDDLLGAWDALRRAKYANRLAALHLKLNVDKSFIAQGGVFCEKLEMNAARGSETRQVPVLGLREAAAAKLFVRGGRKGLYSVRANLADRLPLSKGPLHKLLRHTLSTTHHKGARNGPVWAGGDGGRITSKRDAREAANMIVSTWLKGPVLTIKGASQGPWEEVIRTLKEQLPPAASETTLSDVTLTARIALIRSNPKAPIFRPVERSPGSLRATGKKRAQEGGAWRTTMRLLRGVLTDAQLTQKGKRKLRNLLPPLLSRNPQPKLIRRVAKLTQQHWADPQVDPLAAALVLDDLNLTPAMYQDGGSRPWGFLLKEASHTKSSRSGVASGIV
jgi:hypothetical protein